MTSIESSALVSTILVVVGTVWYVSLGIKGIKVQPVLASWIVICGTMTLSFFTYLTSPKASVVKGACNGISVVSTLAILVLSIWMTRKKKGSLSFSVFQKFSLWSALGITILWAVLISMKGTGIVPNILTQILMLIGYAVTCQKLWYAQRNTESLFCWWCITLAAAVALYTGIVSGDKLVILYASRTLIGITALLSLMYRAEGRARNTNATAMA
ncbi:MAG: hypothetical protein V4664_01680 [Patescibacteria group bacterium]